MARQELLVCSLNDAYAMEHQLIPVLENPANDMANYPRAEGRLRKPIDETRRHAARMDECIRRLGERPSTVKSTLASLMGNAQAIGTGMFRDELIKNTLSDYAAEQFEVACYKALIVAAREEGQAEIARACEENLREDEAMAHWIDQQLPTMVRETMHGPAASV